LQSFIRVFCLSVSIFIAVLILTRFQDIARFTALSADLGKTGLFVFYQIPSILPIAIPISALLASFLLFQRLSRNHELIALRALGVSFKNILMPILLLSLFLSLCNFAICASLSPFCHREGKALIFDETSQNPLLLLRRQKLVNIKNTYLNMKSKDSNTAKDLICIFNNGANQNLNLLSAKKLYIEDDKLLGSNLSIISYRNIEDRFDTLVLENQANMSTAAPMLSNALKKHRSHLDIGALNLKMLQIKAKDGTKPKRAVTAEVLRRASLSLAVFTFTLIGSIFSIEEGRKIKKQNLFIALFLTLLILTSYILGQKAKGNLIISCALFLTPHLLGWIASAVQLKRISKGMA